MARAVMPTKKNIKMATRTTVTLSDLSAGIVLKTFNRFLMAVFHLFEAHCCSAVRVRGSAISPPPTSAIKFENDQEPELIAHSHREAVARRPCAPPGDSGGQESSSTN